MTTKNIKLSFTILAGLVILSYGFLSFAEEQSATQNNIFLDSDQDGLSDEEEKSYGTDPKNKDTDGDGYSDGAEIKSGYDPKKTAPDDKLVAENIAISQEESDKNATTKNLTNDVAEKITTLAQSTDTENGDVSIEQINALMEESLSGNYSEPEFPEIDKDTIKIKEQNYGKLSAEEAKQRKKEDFSKYLAAIFYIFSSNSPEPITTEKDVSSIINSFSKDIIMSISNGTPEQLTGLSASGEKMLEQMNELEVPEDALNIHIKGLQFAKYAISLKDTLQTKQTDPLAYLGSLMNISAFLESSMGFFSEIETKLNEYGLQDDPLLDNDMQKLGLPELTELSVPIFDESSVKDDSVDNIEETAIEN